MDKTDKQLLDSEAQELEKLNALPGIDEEPDEVEPSPLQKAITRAIQDEINRQLIEKAQDGLRKVEITNTPKVVVEFPSLQKIFGDVKIPDGIKAEVTFPEVQKVTGRVKADVDFPDVQKVQGLVKAEVDFPDVQTIKGVVEALIKFPELQRVVGEMVITNLPVAEGAEPSIARANPLRYIPVRLSNGKRFYDIFETMSKSMSQGFNKSGLDIPPHDYVTALYPNATTEQYTYRKGGSSGSVVAIVTVGYTDSTKETLLYVQKV